MVSQNNLAASYVKNSSFVEKQVGDELILVPLTDQVANMGEVFTLNEVGAYIWNCLEIPLTLDQLVGKVIEAFDVPPQTATADVEFFLNQSLSKKLIQLA